MYVVILAGGGGTRLHPLSTPERPKPFLPLLDQRTLLQQTVDRLAGLDLGPDDVAVLASTRYAPLVAEQLPDDRIVEEPEPRNTAAAIALAALAIERDDDDVMVVLPADHAIARADLFRSVITAAAGGLALEAFGVDAPLVTLGIHSDRPATEYGYLRPRVADGGEVGGLAAYPLVAFEEKPTLERALQLCAAPGVAWNAGMFLWRRRAILAALETSRPTCLRGRPGVPRRRSRHAHRGVQGSDPISIDYAVMEPAAADGRVVMAAMDVGWSDLGGWSALLTALDGVAARGPGRPAGRGGRGRARRPGRPPGRRPLVVEAVRERVRSSPTASAAPPAGARDRRPRRGPPRPRAPAIGGLAP